MRSETRIACFLACWLAIGLLPAAGAKPDKGLVNRSIRAVTSDFPEVVSTLRKRYIEDIFRDSFIREYIDPRYTPRPFTTPVVAESVMEKRRLGPEVSLGDHFVVDDRFREIRSLPIIQGLAHLVVPDVEIDGKSGFNGLYRFSDKSRLLAWRMGVKADQIVDMGDGRLIGYQQGNNDVLFRFDAEYRLSGTQKLATGVLLMDMARVDAHHLLFHYLRLFPGQPVAAVVDVRDGSQVPIHLDPPAVLSTPQQMLAAGGTEAVVDRKGRILIGHQVPANLYTIHMFSPQGRLLRVFGNRFESDEEYDYPTPWVKLSHKELGYYGLARTYSIHRILVDREGYILVFFSSVRILPLKDGAGAQRRVWFDLFSPGGMFIRRCSFPYGFARAIDGNDRVYSLEPVRNDLQVQWKVHATKLLKRMPPAGDGS